MKIQRHGIRHLLAATHVKVVDRRSKILGKKLITVGTPGTYNLQTLTDPRYFRLLKTAVKRVSSTSKRTNAFCKSIHPKTNTASLSFKTNYLHLCFYLGIEKRDGVFFMALSLVNPTISVLLSPGFNPRQHEREDWKKNGSRLRWQDIYFAQCWQNVFDWTMQKTWCKEIERMTRVWRFVLGKTLHCCFAEDGREILKHGFARFFFHHWISCFELSHQCFRRSCLWIWWTWRHRYSLSFAVLFWTVSLKAIFDSILSYGKNKKFASYPPIIFSFPPWLLHGHLRELYTKRDQRYSVYHCWNYI